MARLCSYSSSPVNIPRKLPSLSARKENIVAAFQGSQKTVFAISKTFSEAQLFLEALEQGLGGVVLKVEDVKAVIELKEYFDRRNDMSNLLSLTKATVTRVQVAGMGDRVCVDLCSIMRPGEGLLHPFTDAETVALASPRQGNELKAAIAVTSLKVGDEVVLRVQGAARHTRIEIQEFIVEN